MSYFDGSYFDHTYFDTGPSATGGSPRKSLHRYPTVGEMPPIPAWLAIAERKRRREQEQTLRDMLAARQRFAQMEDDEWVLGLRPIPFRRLLD